MPPGLSVIRRWDLPETDFVKSRRRWPHQVKEIRAVAGRTLTWRQPAPAEEELVKWWQPYGKKRTYVNDAQGKTLGYRDELTRRVFVDDPDAGRVRGLWVGRSEVR